MIRPPPSSPLFPTPGLAPPPAATTALPAAEPALASFLLRSAQGGNLAYIALDSFADGATGQLNRWEGALAAATQARVTGLVIDLRAHRGDDAYQLVPHMLADRKSTRLNSSHLVISYAVFCLKKKIARDCTFPHQSAPRVSQS